MPEDKREYEAYNLNGDQDENIDSQDDYYEEDVYSTWSDKSAKGGFLGFLKSNLLLLVVIAAAAVILILLYQRLPRAPFEKLHDNRIAALESSIQKLEDRLAQFEARLTPDNPEKETVEKQAFDQLLSRVDRLEETSFKRTEEIAARLDAMEKGKTSSKAEPPAAAKKPASPAKKASAATSAAAVKAKAGVVYHTVRPKETPYGIAKQYNLTVKELMKLNNLSPTTTIYPGDKLRVSR